MSGSVVPPRPWTLFARPLPGAALRLLCLPFAGGGASAYRPWVERLAPAGIEVWPVQPPGRENRFAEPPYADLGALVRRLAGELGPHLESGPYAVFGHSVGAHVGYAFAVEMRRRGLPEPSHLLVSARRPPHRPDPEPPAHTLSRERLVARLRRYGGVGAGDELLDLVLPLVRADLALVERCRWTPVPPLSCPVTALGGASDSTVPAGELAAWAQLTRGPFRLRLLPGGHFYLAEYPVLATASVRAALGCQSRE